MEFKDYLYIIKKRWFVFILVLLIVFAIHWLYVSDQEASFEGVSRVMITPANNNVGIETVKPFESNFREQWIAFQRAKSSLVSFPVLEGAARCLVNGTRKEVKENEPPNGKTSWNEVLDEKEKELPWIAEYRDEKWNKAFKDTTWYMNIAANAQKQAVQIVGNASETKKVLSEKYDIIVKSLYRVFRNKVDILSDEIELKQPTEIVGIRYEDKNPQIVEAVVNAMAVSAVEYQKIVRKKVVKDLIEYAKAKQQKARDDRQKLHDELTALIENQRKQFMEKNGKEGVWLRYGSDYQSSMKSLQTQISQLETQLREMKAQIIELDEQWEKLNTAKDPDSEESRKYARDVQSGMVVTPEIAAVQAKLNEVENRLAAQKEGPPRRTDKHPTVARLIKARNKIRLQKEQAVARAIKQRLDMIAEEANDLSERRTIVEKQKEELEKNVQLKIAEMKRLSELQTRMELINHTLKEVGSEIVNLDRRLEDLNYSRKAIESSRNTIEIYEPCQSANPLPKKGEKPQDYILTAVLALIASTFLVYFMEYLDTRIASEYDVRRHLNLPVIGVIPEMKIPNILLTTSSPTSEMSERFNTSGTLLKNMMQEKGQKTLLVCSAKPQEGKTTVSVNVAIALARKGINVVLVDTDMRKPKMHTLLNLPNAVGLSTLLEGKFEAKQIVDNILGDMQEEAYNLKDYLLPTEFPNLRVLPSGPIPANPVEFLESSNMKLIVERLKREAELVVFDSPPINTVGDGIALASLLDTCVVVIGAKQVEQQEASWMKHMLSSTQASITGVILNRSRQVMRNEYYYYYNKDRKKVKRAL